MQHPVYKEYTVDEQGKVFRKASGSTPLRQLGMTVCKDQKNKLMMTVYKSGEKTGKKVYAHRFIFECKVGKVLGRSDLVTFIDKDVTNVKPSNLSCSKYAESVPQPEKNTEEEKKVVSVPVKKETKSQKLAKIEKDKKDLEQKIKSRLDLSDILEPSAFGDRDLSLDSLGLKA